MRRVARFLRLPRCDQILLLEAGLLVVLVRLGLTLFSYDGVQKALVRVTRRKLASDRDPSPPTVERVAWAVRATSRYVPAASCLTQALAAHAMLERRDLPNVVRIGTARNEAGAFEAHAWIESSGRVVLGNLRDLERYTPLPPLRRENS